MSLTLILTASLPVVIFLLVIYLRDTEKEPLLLLLKCFFGGICSALVTLSVVSTYINVKINDELGATIFDAFCKAAIPEEILKFFFLFLIVWKNRHFNQFYDGIIYAVSVSLGFAVIENILYVTQGGIEIGIARGIFAIPLHGFVGVIMGYYLSLTKLAGNRISLFKTILFPIIFHGLYNSMLLYLERFNASFRNLLFIIFIVFVVYLWRFGIKKINQHVKRDKKNTTFA